MKNKIIFTLLCTSTQLFCAGASNVYLQNEYGAPIACRINQTNEIKIANNIRVQLGVACNRSGVVSKCISSLDIRTTGIGSGYGLSPYYSLKDIVLQMFRYTGDPKNLVITVHPSSSLSSWNVTLALEASGNIGTFSMKPEENPEIMEKFLKLEGSADRLKVIQDGLFGSDYTNKINAICSANYTQAMKQGKVNLCDNLHRNIVKPEFKLNALAKFKKSDMHLLEPTINEIKETIDLLYRALLRYKELGII